MPELQLHYRTIGAPTGEPVLVLHGTAGSGASMLTPAFAGELFGAGQPLDASRYYIIIPDTLGHGKSSKPSDGLRTKFPKYNYEDMVDAHYRLLTEHLNVRTCALVIGNSMGGMETWIFAVKYPDYMDVAVPMACLPTEMSSRNWMLRRLITDSIRNDPDWKDGQYTQQPRSARFASVFFGIATNGGNQALYKAAPTREKADQLLDAAARGAVPGRRQRRAVPVGFVARLQPVAGPGEDQGHGARDQCGRRRAQSAGARTPRSRDQAREERPRAADPGEREHRGTRHDGQWRSSTSASWASCCNRRRGLPRRRSSAPLATVTPRAGRRATPRRSHREPAPPGSGRRAASGRARRAPAPATPRSADSCD